MMAKRKFAQICLVFSIFLLAGCVSMEPLTKDLATKDWDKVRRDLGQLSPSADVSTLLAYCTSCLEMKTALQAVRETGSEASVNRLGRALAELDQRTTDLDKLADKLQLENSKAGFRQESVLEEYYREAIDATHDYYVLLGEESLDADTVEFKPILDKISLAKSGEIAGERVKNPVVAARVMVSGDETGPVSAAIVELLRRYIDYSVNALDAQLSHIEESVAAYHASLSDFAMQRQKSDDVAQGLLEMESGRKGADERLSMVNSVPGCREIAVEGRKKLATLNNRYSVLSVESGRIHITVGRSDLQREFAALTEYKAAIDIETRRLEQERMREQLRLMTLSMIRKVGEIELFASSFSTQNQKETSFVDSEMRMLKQVKEQLEFDNRRLSAGKSVFGILDSQRQIDEIFLSSRINQAFRFKTNGTTREVKFLDLVIRLDQEAVEFVRYFLFQVSSSGVADLDELPQWVLGTPGLVRIVDLLKAYDYYSTKPSQFLAQIRDLALDAFSSDDARKAITSYFIVQDKIGSDLARPALLQAAFDFQRSAPFLEYERLISIDRGRASSLMSSLYLLDQAYANLYAAYSKLRFGKKDETAGVFDQLASSVPPMVQELQWALSYVRPDLLHSSFMDELSAFNQVDDLLEEEWGAALGRFDATRDIGSLKKAITFLEYAKAERREAIDLADQPRTKRIGNIVGETRLTTERIDSLLILAYLETGRYQEAVDALHGAMTMDKADYDHLSAAIGEAERLENELRGVPEKRTRQVISYNLSQSVVLRLVDLEFVERTLGWVLEDVAGTMFGQETAVVEELPEKDRLSLSSLAYLEVVEKLQFLRRVLATQSPNDPTFSEARDLLVTGKLASMEYAFVSLRRIFLAPRDSSLVREEQEMLETLFRGEEKQDYSMSYMLAMSFFISGQYEDTRRTLDFLRAAFPKGARDVPSGLLFVRTLKALGETSRYEIEKEALAADIENPKSESWLTLPFSALNIEKARAVFEKE